MPEEEAKHGEPNPGEAKQGEPIPEEEAKQGAPIPEEAKHGQFIPEDLDKLVESSQELAKKMSGDKLDIVADERGEVLVSHRLSAPKRIIKKENELWEIKNENSVIELYKSVLNPDELSTLAKHMLADNQNNDKKGSLAMTYLKSLGFQAKKAQGGRFAIEFESDADYEKRIKLHLSYLKNSIRGGAPTIDLKDSLDNLSVNKRKIITKLMKEQGYKQHVYNGQVIWLNKEKIMHLDDKVSSKPDWQLVYKVTEKLKELTDSHANKFEFLSPKFSELNDVLNNKKYGESDTQRLIVFQRKLHELLTEQKSAEKINKHREDAQGSDIRARQFQIFKRYAYNALSVLSVLPALARASASYYNYGTARFWQPQQKRVLAKIGRELDSLIETKKPKPR